jgi:hypothetical protein
MRNMQDIIRPNYEITTELGMLLLLSLPKFLEHFDIYHRDCAPN